MIQSCSEQYFIRALYFHRTEVKVQFWGLASACYVCVLLDVQCVPIHPAALTDITEVRRREKAHAVAALLQDGVCKGRCRSLALGSCYVQNSNVLQRFHKPEALHYRNNHVSVLCLSSFPRLDTVQCRFSTRARMHTSCSIYTDCTTHCRCIIKHKLHKSEFYVTFTSLY